MDEHEFKKLESEVRNGQVIHLIKTAVPIPLSVILGSIIGRYYLDDEISLTNFIEVLPILLILFSLMGGIFSFATFRYKREKYNKELMRREELANQD